jgi:predicted amidophosphoribosyltransferase
MSETISRYKIISNCGYCGSGITEYDRNCPRCGAPNKNNVKNDIIEVREGKGNHLIYSYHSRLEELKQEHNSLEKVRLARISQGLDFADIFNEIRKIENEIGEIKETN